MSEGEGVGISHPSTVVSTKLCNLKSCQTELDILNPLAHRRRSLTQRWTALNRWFADGASVSRSGQNSTGAEAGFASCFQPGLNMLRDIRCLFTIVGVERMSI